MSETLAGSVVLPRVYILIVCFGNYFPL